MRAVLLACALLAFGHASHAAEGPSVEELTRLASQATAPEEALTLLKKAVELAPERADVHLNYGSALFRFGQGVIQAGQQEPGVAMFRDAEKELLAALRLAKSAPDANARRQVKAQAAFLLGESYFFVFKDKQRAKRYYQDSLWYDPQHPGALEARKRFGEE
ncbi:MAG: hypothetical protein HY601_02490 [Candidatus Omnitrophica bacterium]|nr:hypothetical protein [Candidatus Omnitrophota bacterium]